MSREDIVAVALRLIAVYIVFRVLATTPSVVAVWTQEDFAGVAPMVGALLAGFLLVAWLLWMFPLTVARKLLPVMRDTQADLPFSAPLALSLGLTLMGVWLLASGLVGATRLAGLLAYSEHIARTTGSEYQLSPRDIADLAATAAQIVIALSLVLGSSGWQRLFFRLRYGRPDAYAEATAEDIR
jgi:hypothetical protein